MEILIIEIIPSFSAAEYFRIFKWISVKEIEKFEDTQSVIRSRNSKNVRQYNGQKKTRTIMINKIIHRKLKIEQHELHLQQGVNPGTTKSKQFLLHEYRLVH